MKIPKLFFVTMALYILVLSTNTNAQTQTIRTLKMDDRTNPTTYNPDALIDMQSNSKGLLLPRVELTSTTAAAPLANHAQGMVVYNTVSAGSGGTAVSPGYYYNDGTQWVRLGASTGSGWALTGNTGIAANNATYGNSLSAGTGNFLGIINSADLILAANNKEGLRINTSQQILIGTTTVPTGGSLAKVIIDNGTVNGAIQIKDGSQANGYVLTSDANGVAKWKNVTQTVQNNISVTSTVDANILGYVPSTTATAATDAPATLTVGSATATRQGTGTYTVNGHSYATFSTSAAVTWYDAYNAAKAMGGYLATFTTDGEWQYVETNLLTPFTIFNTNGTWIGMCKYSWFAGSAMSPDPDYKWITGELPYHDYSAGGTSAVLKSNWFISGEPDTTTSQDGYVHTSHQNLGKDKTRNGYTSRHLWNDIPTGYSTPGFIVEFQQ